MSWTLDNITLPDGLVWEDEFDWTPVSQEKTVSLTGTLIIQEAAALAGRPITLKGEDSCWTTRAIVQSLYALAQTADKEMTLTIAGTARTVVWSRGNEPPVEAKPVFPLMEPGTDYTYILRTLRFTELES